jgi:hypothetical protein
VLELGGKRENPNAKWQMWQAKVKVEVEEKVKVGGLRQKKSKLKFQMPKKPITSHESRARARNTSTRHDSLTRSAAPVFGPHDHGHDDEC